MAELKLSTEELAQSCYRVWHKACGINPADWDTLSLSAQAAWGRVAKAAEYTLEVSEGKTFAEAARLLALRSVNGDEELLGSIWEVPADRIAWEALTRHLMCLVDEADGSDDLSAAEEMWADWGRQRQPKLNVEV